MKPAAADHPRPPGSVIPDQDSMFDKRSLFIGAGLAAALLTVAAAWGITYHDRGRKTPKLPDFQFETRKPEFEKPPEIKEPTRTLIAPTMVKETIDYDSKESIPDIHMSTDPQVTEFKEQVVKSTSMEAITPVDVRTVKLDPKETVEKADEQGIESTDRLPIITALGDKFADIYTTKDPTPRVHPRAEVVNHAPRPGTKLAITPTAFGPQDVKVDGEPGPLDINLLGNGDYLSAVGRPGLETRTAVDAALRWLSLHQEPDGYWDPTRWNRDDAPLRAAEVDSTLANTPKKADPQVSNRAVAHTAFAALALMGGGNTLRTGDYQRSLISAMRWLISKQDERTGLVVTSVRDSQYMYEHAIATIALCEAFGRSPDEKVGVAARKAVGACVAGAAQDGGWRYVTNSPSSDMSVTSWFLQALKTAKLANIKFDQSAFARGLLFMDLCTDRNAQGKSSGAVSYTVADAGGDGGETAGSPALTCAGMVIRQFNGMGVNHPLLVNAANGTKKLPPNWEDKNFYRWYYSTYAMHNMGGEYRLWWNRCIRDVLLDHQCKRGHQAGSWNPDKERFDASRVYTTALGALCLEVYYRYGPALQSFGTVPTLDEMY
jgi:hypothetical protein